MTRLELRTFLRQVILQEPSAKKWSDGVLNTLLYDGLEAVWEQLSHHTEGGYGASESEPVTITAGAARIPFPAGMLRLQRVERIGIAYPYDLDEIAKEERHSWRSATPASQYPKVYYLEPPAIVLVPTPSVTIVDALVLHGTFVHGDFADDDAEPNFPSKYHRLVAYHAGMNALGFDEVAPEWPATAWNRGVASMIHDLSQHDHQYGVDVTDQGGSAW